MEDEDAPDTSCARKRKRDQVEDAQLQVCKSSKNMQMASFLLRLDIL
jgi:hypothetical protein